MAPPMPDRPILFSAPMIRALLAGRKTQTRRAININRYREQLAGYETTGRLREYSARKYGLEFVHVKRGLWHPETNPLGFSAWYVPIRIAVGDRLWAREAHARVPSSAYRFSEGVQQAIDPGDRDMAIVYRADWERSAPPWRPSIHMPRWGSRITLIVTDVRVQRLQEISEADAIAEGVRQAEQDGPWNAVPGYAPLAGLSPIGGFYCLWNHVNGPGSWEANPWIAAYTFEPIMKNIDALPAVEIANSDGTR